MNQLDTLFATRAPTAKRPLLGLTVLVVEDSRFACEALRLMCLKSGARIRRADSLCSARRHLRTYHPSVVIVDLGLPDGCGAELIKDLAQATPRVDVILASSGDADAETRATDAGADGFLPKPVANLAHFQSAILDLLPAHRTPAGPRLLPNEEISPDPLALRDDLAHVADLLNGDLDGGEIDYVTQFLSGIALSSGDETLQAAAQSLADKRIKGQSMRTSVAQLAGVLHDRLAAQPAEM